MQAAYLFSHILNNMIVVRFRNPGFDRQGRHCVGPEAPPLLHAALTRWEHAGNEGFQPSTRARCPRSQRVPCKRAPQKAGLTSGWEIILKKQKKKTIGGKIIVFLGIYEILVPTEFSTAQAPRAPPGPLNIGLSQRVRENGRPGHESPRVAGRRLFAGGTRRGLRHGY